MSYGHKSQASETFVQLTDRGAPPRYDDYQYRDRWYKRKSIWGIVAGVIVLILIIVIIAVVEVAKKNKYPDYSKLSYSLTDTYAGTSFFDTFDYFTGYDPTQGFVHYVPLEQATALNLTYASTSSAVIRVDTSVSSSSVPNASTGRFSVRITSQKTYGLNTLFLFDVLHTPIGCATWPSLWLTDPSNWPNNGEIDLMESVNTVSSGNNQMTLHTSSGCSMGVKRKQTGKSLTTSCVNSTDDNAGCGVDASTDSSTFGDGFNSAGGGLLALELRQAGIRMWQFPRASIPSDVASGSPDPSVWPEATADFPSTDCDIGTHFKNQSIIANIDLCGSWAGATDVYSQNCPGTCTDYVANNNTAFVDSYWEFGAFNIYSAS